MDENYGITRYELEELRHQRMITSGNERGLVLNYELSSLGFPLHLLPEVYEAKGSEEAISNVNDFVQRRIELFLSINQNDIYQKISVALWMSFPRVLNTTGLDDVYSLFGQTEDLFYLLSPMRKITFYHSQKKTMEELEKHITVWQNWDFSCIPTNAFFHAWDSYNIPHYHVVSSYESALSLYLFNLARTWRGTDGKRATYAIACNNTDFTFRQSAILEQLNFLFSTPNIFPESVLDGLVMNDIRGILGERVPVQYLVMTERQEEVEQSRGHELKMKRLVFPDVYGEPQNEVEKICYDRVPSGPPIGRLHVLWCKDKPVTIPDVAPSYIASEFVALGAGLPPATDDFLVHYPTLQQLASGAYKNEYALDLMMHMIANPDLQVSFVIDKVEGGVVIAEPLIPRDVITSKRIVPELEDFSLLIRILIAVVRTGNFSVNNLDVTVSHSPLWLDVMKRIKPFLAYDAHRREEYGRFHFVFGNVDEFPVQDGTCTINIADLPPIKSVVPLSCITYPGPQGIGRIITMSDSVIGLDGAYQNLSPSSIDWTTENRISLLNYLFGEYNDTVFPEVRGVGVRYQVVGTHEDRDSIIGMGAGLGRGTARCKMLGDTRIVVASGIGELSRIALSERSGWRKFGGKLDQISPTSIFRINPPKFTPPELLTYAQKIIVYQDTKSSTLTDYGSGEYYNVWLTSEKIVQIDKCPLTPSPTGTIVNITYDLSSSVLPVTDSKVGICLYSTFFRTHWDDDMQAYLKSFIIHALELHQILFINFPYWSEDCAKNAGFYEKHILFKNGEAYLKLASYPPAKTFNEGIYVVLNSLDLDKYIVKEISIGYPHLVKAQKLVPRSLKSSVIQEAKALSSFIKMFRIARK